MQSLLGGEVKGKGCRSNARHRHNKAGGVCCQGASLLGLKQETNMHWRSKRVDGRLGSGWRGGLRNGGEGERGTEKGGGGGRGGCSQAEVVAAWEPRARCGQDPEAAHGGRRKHTECSSAEQDS